MRILEEIASKVKDGTNKQMRNQMLRHELRRVVWPDQFQLPLDPRMKVGNQCAYSVACSVINQCAYSVAVVDQCTYSVAVINQCTIAPINEGGHTRPVLVLCSYCAHTVLVLCPYCARTVLILCS
jgi:hypothetical protein